MTGEREVSTRRNRHYMATRGEGEAQARARTAYHSALQRSLIPSLRCALLFADFLEVVVDQCPRALGDASSHLLQARGHDAVQLRAGTLPKVEADVEVMWNATRLCRLGEALGAAGFCVCAVERPDRVRERGEGRISRLS
jgi:hypothetical protein